MGIRPRRTKSFILADGTEIKRSLGQALFRLNGEEAASPVIFGGKGDSVLLGSVSLEVLGEDPREFDRLYADLVEEWRPETASALRLVRHLAELMWKLDRVTRAELAVARRRVEALRAERLLNEQSVGQYRYEGPEAEVAAAGLAGVKDSPGKFEEMLIELQALKRMAQERDTSPSFEERVKRVYGPQPSSRVRLIAGLFRGLAEKQKKSEPVDQEVYADLEKLIDQEIEPVIRRYTFYKKENVEFPVSLRDAQLAPNEPFSALIIRRENSLSRQIERTIRMLTTFEQRKSASGPGDAKPL